MLGNYVTGMLIASVAMVAVEPPPPPTWLLIGLIACLVVNIVLDVLLLIADSHA